MEERKEGMLTSGSVSYITWPSVNCYLLNSGDLFPRASVTQGEDIGGKHSEHSLGSVLTVLSRSRKPPSVCDSQPPYKLRRGKKNPEHVNTPKVLRRCSGGKNTG